MACQYSILYALARFSGQPLIFAPFPTTFVCLPSLPPAQPASPLQNFCTICYRRTQSIPRKPCFRLQTVQHILAHICSRFSLRKLVALKHVSKTSASSASSRFRTIPGLCNTQKCPRQHRRNNEGRAESPQTDIRSQVSPLLASLVLVAHASARGKFTGNTLSNTPAFVPALFRRISG